MARRNRGYYRHHRARVIKRKCKIVKRRFHNGFGKDEPGRFHKGKIHCGCFLCRPHKYLGILNKTNLVKRQSMEEEIKEHHGEK
ncbi:hypothetical protein [Alkalicoccobacillus plakortidis]|uniref:Uncharacterized protein n=1 Tax=Alkalicoccobacillus plakortidis TaxID=444060 RepID=A0ABT0XN97_9BACI|nr:hypothetical protein [Alkalicoccobacillus plakortidis]MCM2677373.1 hypothetical protein [Alkalicoccobacillus plakortidis]